MASTIHLNPNVINQEQIVQDPVKLSFEQDEESYRRNEQKIFEEQNARARKNRRYNNMRKLIGPFINSRIHHQPLFENVYTKVNEEYQFEITLFICFIGYTLFG